MVGIFTRPYDMAAFRRVHKRLVGSRRSKHYLTEEWYLYSIARPLGLPRDIAPNLARFYPGDDLSRIMTMYKTIPDDTWGPRGREIDWRKPE
jgi:hypothetical protein